MSVNVQVQVTFTPSRELTFLTLRHSLIDLVMNIPLVTSQQSWSLHNSTTNMTLVVLETLVLGKSCLAVWLEITKITVVLNLYYFYDHLRLHYLVNLRETGNKVKDWGWRRGLWFSSRNCYRLFCLLYTIPKHYLYLSHIDIQS